MFNAKFPSTWYHEAVVGSSVSSTSQNNVAWAQSGGINGKLKQELGKGVAWKGYTTGLFREFSSMGSQRETSSGVQ